ncbi:MAG: NADH-quinone oxidoreductase subunit NuoH [Desulfovibrionaceae bacterium]
MINPEYYPLVRMVIFLVAMMAFVGLNALVLVYAERKIAGHVQRRPGPFHVGWHGLLQPLADAGKLMAKQLLTPWSSDKLLFWAAPLLSFLPVILLFLPIPFGESLYGLNVNLGVVLILAFSGLNVLALCLAGWASNNKYGLLGAARAVAQSVAYEIPLLISVLTVALMSGSLDLHAITVQQGAWPWQWYGVLNPLAFFIYFISILGETNRAPFDLPEGESELTAGFHTEYSGMGFGMFFLSEYANMVVVCCVASILFLGGYQGPIESGWWWFLLKVYVLLFIIIWMRWTFPRVRFDQLLNINWRWLTPLALLNLVGTVIVLRLAG